jgi:hypothetical protein
MQQWAHGKRFGGWSAFILLWVLFLIDDLVFDVPIWVGAFLAVAGIMAIFSVAELAHAGRRGTTPEGASGTEGLGRKATAACTAFRFVYSQK